MYAQHQSTNYAPQHRIPPAWHHHAFREPIFQVRVMQHTGALMLWINQRSTVTGTYGQCDAAIRAAQLHCLLAGWWSPASVLLLNWIALLVNMSARRTLQRNAAQAAVPSVSPWGPPAPQWQTH